MSESGNLTYEEMLKKLTGGKTPEFLNVVELAIKLGIPNWKEMEEMANNNEEDE